MVLDLAVSLDLKIERWMLKLFFLRGDFDEEINRRKLEVFEVNGKDNYVFKLNKGLYGLKQVPWEWYRKFGSLRVNKASRRLL